MTDHDVTILRLGYRLGRDPRITTHLALVARALGARFFCFLEMMMSVFLRTLNLLTSDLVET